MMGSSDTSVLQMRGVIKYGVVEANEVLLDSCEGGAG